MRVISTGPPGSPWSLARSVEYRRPLVLSQKDANHASQAGFLGRQLVGFAASQLNSPSNDLAVLHGAANQSGQAKHLRQKKMSDRHYV
jgi:hypothetical protein